MAKKTIKEAIMEKKAILSILEVLMETLSNEEKYHFTKSIEDGEEQGKDWRTGELYWVDSEGKRTTENTGTPWMRTLYKTVPKEYSDYTEEDRVYKNALELIRNTLCDLA